MAKKLLAFAILVLTFTLLTLAACGVPTGGQTQPEASPASADGAVPLGTPEIISNDVILAATLTQEQDGANQTVVSAEVVRANAQATLNSANATLGAAQTQDKNNADAIAAQVAATAAIARANAQATLSSAGATQNAAQTQTQYDLQVRQAAGTQTADAAMTQQNKDDLAASTQTAIANSIATQTQVAAATSQWYADQERQRAEQRQGPITFLWMCCLPIFGVVLAVLVIWALWRWVKIQQGNRPILEAPVEKLPAPAAQGIVRQQNNLPPYRENDIIDSPHHLTKPDDQVGHWMDEVKDELQSSNEKDKDDDTDA